jgi:hypothetical protein
MAEELAMCLAPLRKWLNSGVRRHKNQTLMRDRRRYA